MLFNTLTDVRLCRGQDGKLNRKRKTVFEHISKQREESLKYANNDRSLVS